jgi:DNA-binding LacI/PurR family transcriptional regulator
MPTVREIAEHAGVSISTVSLVLNNKPGVSTVMRTRILETLDQLREREEAANPEYSRWMRTTDKNNLSVVVLHPAILRSSQVFRELMQGIQAGATRYQIQLRLAVNEPDLPSDHISQIYFSDPNLYPDGVLVIGGRQDEPLPEQIYNLGIPCVLVGRDSADPNLSSVGRDEEAIAFEATEYLLELGHRAIAFVGGDLVYSYAHSRLNGYRKALEASGISVLDRWIALGEGDKAARAILSASPEITAAILINDAYAMEALPIFRTAGRRIPADLSVISFDDTEEAGNFDPPLTSISYPRYLEGFHSVKVLIERMKQPLMKYCKVIFRASLIKRDSCAPPQKA